MKKLMAVVLIFALLSPFAEAVQTANPWTETTPEEMMEVLGLGFSLPEGAADVHYRMLESEALAEVQFILEETECTARIKPAVEFENISGMYYDWDSVEECSVLWCPGQVMRTEEEGKVLSLCLWYDVVPGLMYSVSAVGETDILALVDAMFMPAQGDVDAAPADVLAEVLIGCTGYTGTAGASLKEAIAAAELLAFAVEYAGTENLEETVQSAKAVLSGEQAQDFEVSVEGICFVIESAFTDYDAIAGLFDDAGVAERMRELIQVQDAQSDWNALNSCL